MWKPTGKKATDKTTGATLRQVKSEYDRIGWEVTYDGVVLGVVLQYDATIDRMSRDGRYVASRRYAKRWSFEPKQVAGERWKRAQFGMKSRGDAVWSAVRNAKLAASK